MSQSAARAARRHWLPTAGPGGEIVADAIEGSRRRMRNARGVQPASVLNVEHVQVAGVGHQVLVTLDTPHGPQAFTFDPADLGPAARRMTDLCGDADSGLFVGRG